MKETSYSSTIKAKVVIITPRCREDGITRPFEIAVQRLREEYLKCLTYNANKDADFVLTLEIKRPKHDEL